MLDGDDAGGAATATRRSTPWRGVAAENCQPSSRAATRSDDP